MFKAIWKRIRGWAEAYARKTKEMQLQLEKERERLDSTLRELRELDRKIHEKKGVYTS